MLSPKTRPFSLIIGFLFAGLAASGQAASFLAPPLLSDAATDDELEHARIFSEPLVPAGSRSERNQALSTALRAHLGRKKTDDVSAIADYVEQNPSSKWNISLLTNLGGIYFQEGRFSLAMEAWEKAWKLGKTETDPGIKPVVDRAAGELAKMNARIGRIDRLETLFAELKGRPITGSATELLTGAAEGLWLMKNQPERAFLCGPSAVGKIYVLKNPDKGWDDRILNAKSTPKGTSMTEVVKLAREVGLDYQMAWRDVGAEIILPSIVNWKVGHWAALARQANGQILVDDPTFGERLWVRPEVLDSEASGYFLVPSGPLPKGWRAVDGIEGGKVWGKGTTSSTDPDPTTPCDKKSGNCAGCGEGGPSAAGYAMAVASGHLAVVSLNIVDTPVFYTPPRGPALRFAATYNQRDANQATTFFYSNLGTKWTFDWLSYIVDNPAQPYKDVKLYVQGGGGEIYSNLSSSDGGVSGSFSPARYSQAKLTRTTSGSYERVLPDGTKETFDVADGPFAGSTSSTRRVFLRQITDPQNNTLTFTYDTSGGMFRVTAVTDAVGQVTTINYDLPGDSLKITKVTDPFGRFATFQYTSGRLTQITDMIGIASQFAYTGDFINALTTPYGTSNFTYGDNTNGASGRTRWLELKDPMNAKERIEYNELTTTNVSDFVPGNSNQVVASAVPANMYNRNSVMYARNTFYWSKKAMMDAPGNYAKAYVYHWLHYNGLSGSILESEKPALEGRIWYNYPGQAVYPGSGPAIFDGSVTETGTMNQPTIIGRVLDDGSTQTYRRLYNAIGQITKEVDPLGRTKTYQYASNGIDLLAIYQQNPSGTSTDGFGVAADRLASYSGYNALHQPVSMTDAAGQTTSYTYNAQGQKLTQTVTRNGKPETTTWSYTGGYLTGVTGPVAGATTSYTYDSIGRVRTTTDSDGYTLTYSYDALNRLTRTDYPDGTYTQTTYTNLDPEWERDRLGRVTHRTYDALRRLTSVTDPENRTTSYAWCACGALDAIIDANNNQTSFTQDVEGRVTQKAYADNSTLTYTYEATTSRLKSILDAKNQTTSYAYNLDDTLGSVTYTGAQYATPATSYTYSSVYPRITAMTDGTGQTQYAYKTVGGLGANRLDTIDGPLANTIDGPQADMIAYTYDELGRALSTKVNGIGNTVTYDALGRVATAANPLGSFTYHYVGQSSRLSSVDRPGGQSVVYSYFGNTGDERLSQIKNLGPSLAPQSKFDYTYNAVGDIMTWKQQAVSDPAQTYTFSYDGADQLRSAWTNGTTLDYRYDPAGNRTSETVNGVASFYTFNSLNQFGSTSGSILPAMIFGSVSEPSIVKINGTQVPVDVNKRFKATVMTFGGQANATITATDGNGNTTTKSLTGTALNPSYDLTGNTINDLSRTYEWDAANRLLAINYSGTSNRTEFTYDGMSRRVQIVEKTGGTVTSTKKFVWIGNAPGEERDGSNNVTKRFYGEGEQIGANSYLFNKDHLGSIREMVNADNTGMIRARYFYDPYGRRTKVSGDLEADFGFTGHYYHAPSSLHLTLFRAYDANMSRWLSRDPVAEDGGINLYGYVSNNPLVSVDRLGLEPRRLEWPRDCAKRIAHEVDGQDPFGNADPYKRWKHCVASCRITRECWGNIFSAWVAGDVYQDPFWESGKDGFGSDPGDRKANKVGREAASCRKMEKSCEEKCSDAFKGGELY